MARNPAPFPSNNKISFNYIMQPPPPLCNTCSCRTNGSNPMQPPSAASFLFLDAGEYLRDKRDGALQADQAGLEQGEAGGHAEYEGWWRP